MKRPITTPLKSNVSTFNEIISGTARIGNLKKILIKAKVFALVLDWLFVSLKGINCAIMIKLIMLKSVPKTSPLPVGFSPRIINTIAAIIVIIKALEQYFF